MARRKKNKKILLVDDNHETLEFISFLLKLRDETLEIVGAPSAEQGMLELRGIDVLLTDLRLPGMDGVQLIKRARAKQPELPTIIMSGMDQDYAREQYGDFDVHAYVQKPYKPDELVSVILSAIWGDNIPESIAQTAPAAETVSDTPEPRSDIHHPPLAAESTSRLERLQSQTNAHQVIVWGLDGAMIYIFDESKQKEAEKLAKPAISSITGGLEMLVRSGSTPTQMITVLDGEPYEIVLAYIKSKMDYCLAIVVDGDDSQTKLSTVWGAMQRTVADLRIRLNPDNNNGPAEPAEEAPVIPQPVAKQEPPPPLPSTEPEIEPDPIASDDELADLIDGLVGDDVSDNELDDFWGIESSISSAPAAGDDTQPSLQMPETPESSREIDASTDPELAALLADVEGANKDDIPGLVDMLKEKDSELVDERWEEIKDMLGLDEAADEFWENAVKEDAENRAQSKEDGSGIMSYKEALDSGLLRFDPDKQ
ncbi:MAG: response regulator [Chloroflexota bacterium]